MVRETAPRTRPPFYMSVRRVISVPVPNNLDAAIRRAADKEKLTVAEWMRRRALNALQGPEPPGPGPLAASFGRLPRAWTVGDAGMWLNLSPSTIVRKLRAGQLAGYHEQMSFYDHRRRRWLRRRWWMVPSSALFTYMDERLAYEVDHGRRPYTRRPADAPRPAAPLADPVSGVSWPLAPEEVRS